MPELSRFLGIVITMFYRDHAPPHFHASYGEFDIEVSIGDGVVTGHLAQVLVENVRYAAAVMVVACLVFARREIRLSS